MHFNGNGGAQALNLAVLWGARRLVLVGFDMRSVDRRQHWFGEHPARLTKTAPDRYRAWARMFDRIAVDLKRAGVETINCSPISALTQFPKMRLEDVCPLPSA